MKIDLPKEVLRPLPAKYIVEYYSKTEQRFKQFEFDSLSMAETFYNGLSDYDGRYLSRLSTKESGLK